MVAVPGPSRRVALRKFLRLIACPGSHRADGAALWQCIATLDLTFTVQIPPDLAAKYQARFLLRTSRRCRWLSRPQALGRRFEHG